MKNSEVVKSWVHSMIADEKPAKSLVGNSLMANGKYLISYNTPIAKYKNGRFEIAMKKYSCTTSKHVSLVKHLAPLDLIDNVDEVSARKGEFPWRW